MENFTNNLARRLMRDNLIHGPLLTKEQRRALLERQVKLLKETQEAEARLDQMLKEAEATAKADG